MVEVRFKPREPRFIPVSDPDSNVGKHKAVRLVDGVDVTVRIEFTIHRSSLTVAKIVLVPGGSGDLRRSVYTEWGKENENYDAGSDSISSGLVAVISGKVSLIDILTALDGIEEGDQAGVEFTRHGSNDTVNADVQLLGLRLK